MKSPRRYWTYAEDRQLRALAADGYTAAEIAAELGRSYMGVRDRMVRRKVKSRATSPPDAVVRAEVIGFVEAGLSVRQIAVRRGTTKQAAYQLLWRLRDEGIVTHTGYGRWAVTQRWAGVDRD